MSEYELSGEQEVMDDLKQFKSSIYKSREEIEKAAKEIYKKLNEKIKDQSTKKVLDFYLDYYFKELYDRI